ncbi:MAG: PP2C family protein-serine/threonine phosphatase [Chloroflexia bacterium]
MDIQLAVAKTNKYASRESGDTVEVVERPNGGFSVVLVDAQGSGASAKIISHLVTAKAISMIKEGARDGVVARSVNDYLHVYRGGKVSATLVIVSVDLNTRTLVLSRNSHCPIIIALPNQEELTILQDEANPIGTYPLTKPVIAEIPLQAGTYLVTYSDGLMEAGKRDNRPIDITMLFRQAITNELHTAQALADYIFGHALEADANRPADDMSVLVLTINERTEPEPGKTVPQVRQFEMKVPV